MRLLIEAQADIHRVDRSQTSVLHLACRADDPAKGSEMVRQLIYARANIEQRDRDDESRNLRLDTHMRLAVEQLSSDQIAGYKELSQLILEKDPEWAEKQEAAAKAALKENGVGEPQFAQITALELEVTKARLAQATKELAKQSKASKNNAALLAPHAAHIAVPAQRVHTFSAPAKHRVSSTCLHAGHS